jgi:hypothetical protein
MPINEFLILQKNDSETLDSGDKSVDFSDQPLSALFVRFDRLAYAKFRIKKGAAGRNAKDDGEKQRSFFIKVDRMRLGFLDALLFYPVALTLIVSFILWYYALSFGWIGGTDMFQWYPPFWQGLATAASGFLDNTYPNAFAMFAFFDTLIGITFSMLFYLLAKFLIGWTPSVVWRWIFKILGKA